MYAVHAISTGLKLSDLIYLDVGFVIDMIIEQENDMYDWPEKAGQEDFDMFRDM